MARPRCFLSVKSPYGVTISLLKNFLLDLSNSSLSHVVQSVLSLNLTIDVQLGITSFIFDFASMSEPNIAKSNTNEVTSKLLINSSEQTLA